MANVTKTVALQTEAASLSLIAFAPFPFAASLAGTRVTLSNAAAEELFQ
jgi:hypothetical protein